MTAERLGPEQVERAVAWLSRGELVGLPTETVYGLGALGLNAVAVARIFAAKGRPADNPLILHVHDVGAALALWRASEREEQRVFRLGPLWPGPLTLVLPARSEVPGVVTAGLPTVAVRVPGHPVTLRILARLAAPVAAPSANRSGEPSPTRAEHVLAGLGDRVAAVVDGGPCAVGVESTVLDLRGERPRILRPGALGRQTLSEALGEEVADYAPQAGDGSPGLRHRHYVPRAAQVGPLGDAAAAWQSSATLVLFAATAARLRERLGPRRAPVEVLGDDPVSAMRGLYAALHRAGEGRPEQLLIELPPSMPGWEALADRMGRAAGV